jgi:hypothetical protein
MTQFKNAQDPNISKEDLQMANSNIKKHPISLVIRKMQVKATLRHHSTSIRMVILIFGLRVAPSTCYLLRGLLPFEPLP